MTMVRGHYTGAIVHTRRHGYVGLSGAVCTAGLIVNEVEDSSSLGFGCGQPCQLTLLAVDTL